MSNRKIILIAFAVVVLLVAGYCLFFNESRDQKLIRKGNEIVKEIDSFVGKNGRLPSSISEIGIREELEGPIYYELKDSSEYILWFGTDLGESTTYYSTKKKWE